MIIDNSIIEKFLKTINDNATLPNYKRTIFHKLMKSMNFKYERKGCKKKIYGQTI